MAVNRFRRHETTYACRCCGKKTRETGAGEVGVQLCRACLRDAEWENHHSDECHDGARDTCPVCRKEGYPEK